MGLRQSVHIVDSHQAVVSKNENQYIWRSEHPSEHTTSAKGIEYCVQVCPWPPAECQKSILHFMVLTIELIFNRRRLTRGARSF